MGKTRENKIRTLQKLLVTQGKTSGKPLLWGFGELLVYCIGADFSFN